MPLEFRTLHQSGSWFLRVDLRLLSSDLLLGEGHFLRRILKVENPSQFPSDNLLLPGFLDWRVKVVPIRRAFVSVPDLAQ